MKSTIQSSRYNYRRDDYFFRRDQSPAMRRAEWEGRTKPLRSRFSPKRLVDLVLNVTQIGAERGQ